MELSKVLEDKIEKKRCTIGVVGLGYVGLPTAALFADAGYEVRGADLNPEIIEKVNQGASPICEKGMKELIARTVSEGKLRGTTDTEEVVREGDVVFIIVQTPIDGGRMPDLGALESACRSVSRGLSKGKLIVVESTMPPGTMNGLIRPVLEESGLIAGRDFYLAYSPERAIPTKTLEEMRKNSRIVGGVEEKSSRLAAMLYSKVTTGGVIEAELNAVEMAKLIENTYRDVNIALSNEIAVLCEKLGVDALEAIELANLHPRVNLHAPGPGVGGHCLPKDPYFLIGKAKELGIELRVISGARETNESMPGHVLKVVEGSLKSVEKELHSSKVSILGITYKGDTDDTRGTPAEHVIRELMGCGCEIHSHDPYAKHDFGGKFSNDFREVVKGSDCVVIMTDHEEYRRLDITELSGLMRKPGVLVDARRLLNPEEVELEGISYFGIGY